ncbi:MAG: TonB-dependent receptor plug domain-containing protein [Dysgonamonadaceae bacterium]|jgi:iron complex outermembrane receptor protein|nr:TonB-dependent receptor plug domain-containing protein [Dysgonamonadaceae bacterium]
MGGMQIKIRGAASLNPSSNVRPLFVVDGVPIYDTESSMASRGYDPLNSFDYGSGINDINPEDIESMEILKGAKASVLYGSAGANGVVLITTKNGKTAQGIGIQVNYGHEWEKPLSLIDFQNKYGTGQNEYTMAYTDDTRTQRKNVSDRFNFGPKFDGTPMQFFDGTIRPYQTYPNNFLDLFQNGSADYTTVSLQGGGQKGNARLAYTNYDYNGIMENQNHRKNTLSFNGTLRPSDVVSFEFTEKSLCYQD